MSSEQETAAPASDLATELLLFAEKPVVRKQKKKLGASRKNLFVRNLPISATNQSLEDLFTEIGPIKRCFIVTDTDNHNICAGYGFVHFALEESAQKALKTLQGHSVGGKNIIIEQAIPRETRTYIPKHQRVEQVEDEDSDEDMAPIVANTSRKKQRTQLKISDPARVVVVSGEKIESIKPEDLRKFVKKFKLQLNLSKIETINGRIYITLSTGQQARTLSNLLKDKTLNDVKLDSDVLGDGKRSRLIIRNLSFQCPAKHLTNVFSKFGQVVQVSIPKKKGAETKSGFAFVQFLLHSEAQKAMESLNGSMIDKRPIAVDWALPKDKYVKHVIQSQQDSNPDTGNNGEDSEEESSDEESDKDENESSSSDSDSDSSDNDENSSDSDSSEEEEEEEDDDEDEEAIGSFDIHQGATIFIRNISFESSHIAIEELFSKWGTVEYANIVRDFETKRSRGTAFVKFKEAAAAEQCLSESYPQKTHADREGESVTSLDGRNLILSIAVDRKKAKELAEREKKPKQKEDKRNLYLAYEGVISEQDEAAQDMSKADLAKRTRAMIEKKTKLQNPNFFVSKTRLSIRNIPKEYDDKDLRALFKKHSPIGSALKQVKIVRETDRVDSSSGKARSRGFGFVEFKEHSDALESLRALNNNPKIWTKQARPIVEFAVENVKALQKLHATMSRGKVNPKASEQSNSSYGSNKRSRNEFKDSKGKQGSRNVDKNDHMKQEKPLKKKARTEKTEQKQEKRGTQQDKQREQQNARKSFQAPRTDKKPRTFRQQGNQQEQKSSSTRGTPPQRQAISRPSRSKGEKKDSFDNIVDNYKRKFMRLANDSTKGNKKWYD